MPKQHEVVIIGGGFGGLHAARALAGAPARVTLIDKRNFHLFQPLLYQVATGGLSPANIAAPLRALLKGQRNARVMLGNVDGIDVDAKRIRMGGVAIDYDTLIVATGVRHNYFGNDHWEKRAPGLKTVEDATEIRRRILTAFERAELEHDPAVEKEWTTFAVVGGGPTGVELAGALAEIAHHTLRDNFREIDPSKAEILLLEGTDRVLQSYPPELSDKAARSLARLGVTVLTGTMVTNIEERAVMVRREDKLERIPTRTVLWAAGVQASPLGRVLANSTGATIDRAGRVIVQPNLTVPGYPDILVIGDLAHFAHQGDAPLPGVAPVAMQQGDYAAALIRARIEGREPPPFRYRHRGSMATIGRAAAVVDMGRLRFSGFFAWLTWLFVHVLFLVEFENRLLVLSQWAWNYATRNRAARLITQDPDNPA